MDLNDARCFCVSVDPGLLRAGFKADVCLTGVIIYKE